MKHTAGQFLRKRSLSQTVAKEGDDDVMEQHGIMVVAVLIVK